MYGNKIHNKRILFIIGAVVIVGALVVVRLFTLQVVRGSAYAIKAEDQYVSKETNFDRGSIYFTDKDGGTVAAATIESGYKFAIVPGRLTDPQGVFAALSEKISLDKDKFFESVTKKTDPYEEIATRIRASDVEGFTTKDMPGLMMYRDKWRFYPGGPLASKAIGFVSYKDDTLVGNYGLESYYNDVLSRTSADLSVNFFAELFANVKSSGFKNTTAVGDVITSIEPTVQSELERAVASVRQKWASDAVGAVVMDPHTGEIIAMAQVPTFDLNNYREVSDISIYTNPFAQNVYEMGSIIKPIVMSSALDVGAVTPQTTYHDAGSVVVDDRTIYNFDKKGRGTVDMQQVLSQSLNTGMVFVGNKMGKTAFREYMIDRFKFGEKTGVDLPGEIGGLVGNLKTPNNVNYSNAAFGQGIATTPLGIIRAYAALANGGYLITPHLATAIREESGKTQPLEYKKSGPIIKPETVSTITTMLTKVVDEGYHKGNPHYRIAAKTGTAQVAKQGGAGYYEDRNLHSLIGYFPATNPRFVVYFFNYYPKNGGQFAIQTLADEFFGVVQFLSSYYQLTPDR